MITHLCDRCGRSIDSKETRYLARIQVMAAADPLEISAEELQQDHRDEMDRLLAKCAEMTEEELMADVFVEFRFALCRSCQKTYIANPLGKSGGTQSTS